MCHAVFRGEQHAGGGPAVIDAQTFQGVAHMVGDGVVGETQLLADLLAGQVLADQPQNLSLAGGQALELSVPLIFVTVHLASSKLFQPESEGAQWRPKLPAATITQFSLRPRMIFLDACFRT